MLEIEAIAGKQEEVFTYLDRNLKAFNDTHSPFHQLTRDPENIKSVTWVVKDPVGQIKGGLYVRLYWNWLEIAELFLEETIRKQGVGSRLLTQAEQLARANQCLQALVKTFSFQAVEFYQKNGYQIVGKIENYPPGADFVFLQKQISNKL